MSDRPDIWLDRPECDQIDQIVGQIGLNSNHQIDGQIGLNGCQIDHIDGQIGMNDGLVRLI